jgi:tetratricopeptide (TPR) repeat protein
MPAGYGHIRYAACADLVEKMASVLDEALATGDLNERLALLLEAEKGRPADSEVKLELGKAYLRLGDLNSAETSLRSSQHLEDDGWARLYLGNVYERRKEYDKAEAEFYLAHEKRPDLTTPLWCLGDVKDARGDPTEAERLYRLALDLDAGCHEALARIGRLRFRLGELDEAAEFARLALEIDPDSTVARRIHEKMTS